MKCQRCTAHWIICWAMKCQRSTVLWRMCWVMKCKRPNALCRMCGTMKCQRYRCTMKIVWRKKDMSRGRTGNTALLRMNGAAMRRGSIHKYCQECVRQWRGRDPNTHHSMLYPGWYGGIGANLWHEVRQREEQEGVDSCQGVRGPAMIGILPSLAGGKEREIFWYCPDINAWKGGA